MEPISDVERQRIAELLAGGAPVWKLNQEINRSRYAIRRAVVKLHRPAKKEPVRSPLRLSPAEREEISRGLAAGQSMRQIARGLKRSPSTVCREIAANGGPQRYRACDADRRAVRRQRRPKPARLAQCPRLREVVEAKLELRWSPQQIAAWLKTAYPGDPEMRVSHETIYLSLFVQTRGALRRELFRCLRTGRARRRPQGTTKNGQGKIRNAISISERPAEASDRAIPGHWEGDLIYGKAYSAIATLVERKSRFVMLVQLSRGQTAEAVAEALADAVVTLPGQLRRSLTWDQGKEMAEHAKFTVTTDLPVYFCDPHSPWQRGSNENTNGLLRQYFPRSTDFKAITQSDLDRVAAELNGRPRQTLEWKTPCQALDEALR